MRFKILNHANSAAWDLYLAYIDICINNRRGGHFTTASLHMLEDNQVVSKCPYGDED